MDVIELNLDKETREKITKLVKNIPKTAKTEKFFILNEESLLKAVKGDKIYQLINSKKEMAT